MPHEALVRNGAGLQTIPAPSIDEVKWRGKSAGCDYSFFGSALYRDLAAKWPFPQEKAALQNTAMPTCESKTL
jgi:hypothetical protein